MTDMTKVESMRVLRRDLSAMEKFYEEYDVECSGFAMVFEEERGAVEHMLSVVESKLMEEMEAK